MTDTRARDARGVLEGGSTVSAEALAPIRGRATAAPRIEQWALAAVFIISAAVAWLRMTPLAATTVYAEDGRVFLGDQENAGFWPSLFSPYTGYLQFLPRVLVAAVRALWPLSGYPLGIATACALVVGATSAGVFVWSRSVSTWVPFRLSVAFITVLAPVAPIEVAGNVANLHWYMLWGAFWLVMHRPAGRVEATLLGFLAAVFALTEIQTLLLTPLFLLHVRTPRFWIVRGGLLAGLALQLAGLLHAPRSMISTHPSKSSVVAGWFLDVPTAVFAAPDATRGTVVSTFGPLIGIIAALPPLVALVYVLVRGSRTTRSAALGLAVLAIVVWFAAVWANTVDTGAVGFDVHRATPEQFVSIWYSRFALVPSRYSLVPSMCLAALPVLGAAVVRSRFTAENLRMQRIPAVVPAALLAAMAVSFVPIYSTRDGGPNWPAQVAGATRACASENSRVDLRTAPAGWSVTLPCSVFR